MKSPPVEICVTQNRSQPLCNMNFQIGFLSARNFQLKWPIKIPGKSELLKIENMTGQLRAVCNEEAFHNLQGGNGWVNNHRQLFEVSKVKRKLRTKN